MQFDIVRHPEMKRRSPRRRRLMTVALATLSALVAFCLLQLACRSSVPTAKGNVPPTTGKVQRRAD